MGKLGDLGGGGAFIYGLTPSLFKENDYSEYCSGIRKTILRLIFFEFRFVFGKIVNSIALYFCSCVNFVTSTYLWN